MQSITIDKKGKAKKVCREWTEEEFRKRLDELIEEDKNVLLALGRE